MNDRRLRARRLLPFTIAIPLFLGALSIYGHLTERLGAEWGILLLTFASSLALSGVAVWTVRRLNELDRERTRTEEQLRRSNQRKAATFDAALDGIVTIDQRGNILEFNAAAERIFGRSRSEVLGRHMADLLIPQPLREAHHNGFARYLATGEARVLNQLLRMRALHSNGTEFPIELAITMVPQDDGPAFTGFIRDVSEQVQAEVARRRAELEQQRSAKDLERSNQELQNFAYVASHDLQEPLRTLSGFSDLMSRRYRGRLDAEADEYLGYIRDGASRLQALIRDLLEYSRVGTRGGVPAPVESEEVLREALADLHAAEYESAAQISQDPLPRVCADRTQLRQLLVNLIGNAIKYRRPDLEPRIHVSAQSAEGFWQFSVRDNGLGIEPQHFDRVFLIFQRLHGRGEYAGTGIGLAICKKIVQRHGGRLWLESTAGEGSTFFFTLPVVPVSAAEPAD